MHTLRRCHVKKILCNPNTQWSCWVTAVTAMKRKGKGTNLRTFTCKMLACALSRLLCHWCCLTVLTAPVHGVFLLSTWCFLIFSFSPPLHSSWCESFIVNTNKLFLPSPWQQLRFLQHQMAMAAAAAQAAHLHHQQHSGSHSKSKRKRGTPAPPKSWVLPPPQKKLIWRVWIFFQIIKKKA